MVQLAIILLLLGVAVIAVGRRGFRVGHHPHCTACDFDLYNLPEQTQRCPECGAYIRLADAVRLGRRRPVRPLLAIGIVLLLAGGALALPGAARLWAGFNADQFKPVSWLQRDLDATDSTVQRLAGAELVRRIRAGSLDDAQLDTLAAWVLRRQADPTISWQPTWGDLLQAARASGRLGPGRWTHYLEGAMQVQARVRPRVRLGDPFPVEVTCTLRGGSDYRAMIPAQILPQVHVALQGTREAADLRAREAPLDLVPIPLHWLLLWIPAENAITVTGERKLHVEVTLTLRDRDGATATTRKTLELPVELLEKPSVELGVVREGMEREMEVAVKWRGPETIRPLAGTPVGTLWIGGPPMAGSFRIILRQGSHEWLLARTLVRMNDAVNVPLKLPVAVMPRPGPAEVVCIPEPEEAVGTVEVLEVWPREVKRPVVIAEDTVPG